MWQAVKQELKEIYGTYGIAGSSTQAGAESAGEFLSIASSSQQSQTNQSNKSCTPPPQTQPAYCPKQIPTYIEDGNEFPNHARLVKEAIDQGYPSTLTKRPERYDNSLIARARREFERSTGGIRASILDLEFDEYPYASTYENKKGSPLYIKPISTIENKDAGRELQTFYSTNKVRPGCLFNVKVINVLP
jgi:hypothetical protein